MAVRWTEEEYKLFCQRTGRIYSSPKTNALQKALQKQKSEPKEEVRVVMTDAYRSKKKGWREFSGDKKYYLKSLSEINYAHYLEYLKHTKNIKDWVYEPRLFEFPKDDYKTGPFAYKPDFLVTFHNGQTEWHEVKGWLNGSSKKKLKRFAIHFPKEKLILIGPEWFSKHTKTYRTLIPYWESLS